MNLPDSPTDGDLEKLLAKFSPAPPSGKLLDRLQGARPQPSRLAIFRWAAPLAAAAAIALVLIPSRPIAPIEKIAKLPAPAVKSEILHAVESRQVLVDVKDLGVTSNSASGPVRMILTTWVDEISYAEPGAPAEVIKSWLRREVVPVSIPIF